MEQQQIRFDIITPSGHVLAEEKLLCLAIGTSYQDTEENFIGFEEGPSKEPFKITHSERISHSDSGRTSGTNAEHCRDLTARTS